MKAAWISDFRAELVVQLKAFPWVKSVELHSRSTDLWIRDGHSPPVEGLLDRALSAGSPLKVGRQKRYLFGLDEAKAVIDVEFAVFPKTGKLSLVRQTIERIRDHSQHKFDAHHDALTGCKNRKSFDKAIRVAVESLASKLPDAGPALGLNTSRSLALVTLDIDYFKRINDTRGHDYGDVVLRSLAWLVDDLCVSASSGFKNVDFQLFRLGGEEFNILIAGEMDERELLSWVDGVRESIDKTVVPSEEQLKIMEREAGASIPAPADLPPLSRTRRS